MGTTIRVATIPVTDVGNTVIGLLRAIARTRAAYIEDIGLPADAVVPATFPGWLFGDYAARPSGPGIAVLAKSLEDIGVEPILL